MLSSLGSFLISEHDAAAEGLASVMLTALKYVTDNSFESTRPSKQSQLLAVLGAGSSVWQRPNRNDLLVEICVKV